jgi:hypothetical protein
MMREMVMHLAPLGFIWLRLIKIRLANVMYQDIVDKKCQKVVAKWCGSTINAANARSGSCEGDTGLALKEMHVNVHIRTIISVRGNREG